MTPKQMYTELSKIAGHSCGDGRPFAICKRVSKPHIEIVQQRILALLEKLNYDRTQRDFRHAYREPTVPVSRRRMARAQRMLEQEAGRDRIGGGRLDYGHPYAEPPTLARAPRVQAARREPEISRLLRQQQDAMSRRQVESQAQNLAQTFVREYMNTPAANTSMDSMVVTPEMMMRYVDEPLPGPEFIPDISAEADE